jgi:hypothetical protein
MSLNDSTVSAESGGDPSAKIRIERIGPSQLLDSTLQAALKAHRPHIARGQSEDALPARKSDPALAAGMTGAHAALQAQYHIDTAENPFPILRDAIGNDAAGRPLEHAD